MDDWQKMIERRLTLLETRSAVDEVHRGNVELRLASIEDMLKWLVRLIMGALIMAVVAYVLKEGLIP